MFLKGIEKEYSVWALIALFTFTFLQMGTSFLGQESFLSLYGGLHIIWLLSYLVVIFICLRLSYLSSFVFIFIYQGSVVFFLLSFYISIIGNPLGIDPNDARFYDEIARHLAKLSFLDSISYLLQTHDVGEIAYTQIIRLVYMLPGDPIINMKFINVALHMFSGLFVYKTAKLLGLNSIRSKLIFIIFCMNPASVYFNSSGLKEPVFQFLIAFTIYVCYLYLLTKKSKYLVMSLLLILSTGFFRIPYPIIFIVGFSVYIYLGSQGQAKIFARTFLIIVIPIIFFGIWLLLKDAITHLMDLDISAVQAHRLGRENIGLKDYLALVISGFIGPVPSFLYDYWSIDTPLFTIQNYIKILLSVFFVYSIYEIYNEKLKLYYPIVCIYMLNASLLILTAATFDFRFIYPLMPIFYLVLGRRFISYRSVKKAWFWGGLSFGILFIFLYNFR